MDKDAYFDKITDIGVFKNTYEARKAKRVSEFEGYAVGGDSTAWQKFIVDSLSDMMSDAVLQQAVDTSVKPKPKTSSEEPIMCDILTYR